MSTVKTTTLSNLAGDKTVPVDTVVQGSAKAWVNFNGTGTVAIRASFNVSSITDNGTGDYTVNFTSAMLDANYSIIPTTVSNAAGDCRANCELKGVLGTGATLKTTTQVGVISGYAHSATLLDSAEINIAILR